MPLESQFRRIKRTPETTASTKMVAVLQCARQIRALSTMCSIGQFLATNFEGEIANDVAGFVPDSRGARFKRWVSGGIC